MKSSKTSPNLIIVESIESLAVRFGNTIRPTSVLRIEMTREEVGIILENVNNIARYYYTGKHPDGKIP